MNESDPNYTRYDSIMWNASFLVFLQTALQYFFENAVIPIYSGNTVINLLKYLPMVKQGYISILSLPKILNDYVSMNDSTNSTDSHGNITQDALPVKAFAGNIPASHYVYIKNGAQEMVIMQYAVESGLIPDYLNTFQVITRTNPNFRLNDFLYIRSVPLIMYLNTQNSAELPELATYFENAEFKRAIINEALIIDDIDIIINSIEDANLFEVAEIAYSGSTSESESEFIPESKTITSVIEHAIAIDRHYLLDQLLADDPLNKLIYAIILNDPNLVEQYLTMVDPRDNDLVAYHTAVEKGNPLIIERIRKAIIERNALEQRIFHTMMVPVGEFDIPQTEMLRQYGRSLVNK